MKSNAVHISSLHFFFVLLISVQCSNVDLVCILPQCFSFQCIADLVCISSQLQCRSCVHFVSMLSMHCRSCVCNACSAFSLRQTARTKFTAAAFLSLPYTALNFSQLQSLLRPFLLFLTLHIYLPTFSDPTSLPASLLFPSLSSIPPLHPPNIYLSPFNTFFRARQSYTFIEKWQ